MPVCLLMYEKQFDGKPDRSCLMMNLRTAGMNCFSVRGLVFSSHRNRHTTWSICTHKIHAGY